MNEDVLARLAAAAGLRVDWIDANGRPQKVAAPALQHLLGVLGLHAGNDGEVRDSLARLETEAQALPALLTADTGNGLALHGHFAAHSPWRLVHEDGSMAEGHLDEHGNLPGQERCGYHQLWIGDRELALLVAPPACPSVQQLCGRPRIWGLTAQLYSLRRDGDGGLGDSAALEDLLSAAARLGADAVGISPMHAMSAADRGIYSPYSPSSRLFFNELHAAPSTILGQATVQQVIERHGLGPQLQQLEALQLVDWPAAAQLRERLLRQLYLDFLQRPTPLHQDFADFRASGGDVLLQHCCFQALQSRRVAAGDGLDWRRWPSAYRRPDSPEVQRFIAEEAAEVGFYAFGQWLSQHCLQHAQRIAREAGMGIGLIADLAVGALPGGSQAWSRQDELLAALDVGAPPDILNRDGQAWGITAFSPVGLRRHGYRAFIEMLRANLANVGGLRIDHVMGLQRLWVIPEGAKSQEGAYLYFPFDDLLRIVCLEASRANALIIGEDLGTVPNGLRERLAQRNILGTRVLIFEQQHGRFPEPAHWSAEATATSTTHDLPSLNGWFIGRDIDWRQRLGQDAQSADNDRRHRDWEQRTLREALAPLQGDSHDPLQAAAAYLGETPAPLVLFPLEDALGSDEQPNLPGPGNEHPNWRRRWSQPAAQLLDAPEVQQRLGRLDQARRRERP